MRTAVMDAGQPGLEISIGKHPERCSDSKLSGCPANAAGLTGLFGNPGLTGRGKLGHIANPWRCLVKYYNELNMGEGVAGTDQIGASTTVLYTCMGITFVNRQKRFGGVYHYPSGSMKNGNVVDTIRQMANDIAPDEIVLTPAASDGMFGGSSRDDIEDVTDLLNFLCHKVTQAEANFCARLYWTDSGPVFNEQLENAPNPEAVPQQFRSTMSIGKREMHGNVWYYGGDGERKGVLEQKGYVIL